MTGRHRLGPAEVVALQRIEQLVDVSAREAAPVTVVVEVARRRGEQDELGEPVRVRGDGEHADHRGDRVADEDDVAQVELAHELEDVVGVTVQ